jgi:hypothetical protein
MGNNWFLKVKCPAVYNVKDGVIYAINSSLENDYLGSMNFFRSNLENKMDRLVSSLIQRYTFAQQYTDLIFIGRDTIITVGWDKTINISYDGGYTWHLKSNFRIEKSSSNIWLNDSTGFLATDYGRVFKTTNGGITWLPQKYTDPNTSKIETYSLFYIDKSGKGLIYYPISIKYFFNILYTTDHGETFTARADSNFWGLLMDGLQSLVNIGKDYLFIFPGKWSQNHFTLIFTMDSLFNVKSNTLLDSINLRDVRLINDSTIMALAIERRLPKGSDVFDSIDYK